MDRECLYFFIYISFSLQWGPPLHFSLQQLGEVGWAEIVWLAQGQLADFSWQSGDSNLGLPYLAL